MASKGAIGAALSATGQGLFRIGELQYRDELEQRREEAERRKEERLQAFQERMSQEQREFQSDLEVSRQQASLNEIEARKKASIEQAKEIYKATKEDRKPSPAEIEKAATSAVESLQGTALYGSLDDQQRIEVEAKIEDLISKGTGGRRALASIFKEYSNNLPTPPTPEEETSWIDTSINAVETFFKETVPQKVEDWKLKEKSTNLHEYLKENDKAAFDFLSKKYTPEDLKQGILKSLAGREITPTEAYQEVKKQFNVDYIKSIFAPTKTSSTVSEDSMSAIRSTTALDQEKLSPELQANFDAAKNAIRLGGDREAVKERAKELGMPQSYIDLL